MCTDTYLTKSLGLSHQYKHIGGQYGQAEVHQNDGPLWTNVPENQRKSQNDNFNSICFAVTSLLSLQKHDIQVYDIKVRDPFINIHLSFFHSIEHWQLEKHPRWPADELQKQAPVSKMSSSAIWALASSVQGDNDSVPWINGLSDRGGHDKLSDGVADVLRFGERKYLTAS